MKFSPAINEDDVKQEVRRRIASCLGTPVDGISNFIRDAQIDAALGNEAAKATLIMVRKFNAASDALRNGAIPTDYRDDRHRS